MADKATQEPAKKPTKTRKRKQSADQKGKRRKIAEKESSKQAAVGKVSSCKTKKTTKKKKKAPRKTAKAKEGNSQTRNLNEEERKKVQEKIDREEVVLYVHKTVSEGILPDLFPERLILWEKLQYSIELKKFLHSAIDKYRLLLIDNGKGKDKYANLYIAWLDYICSFTCPQKQTLASIANLAILKGNADVSFNTQRTVTAALLHAVQDGLQIQIARKIEHLSKEGDSSITVPVELPADDIALYRLSGWALKSCIDNCKKESEKRKAPCAHAQEQLQLLQALKLANDEKTTLPVGVQYLDRGGMTFCKPNLLPWLQKVEASVKVYLNQDGYARYGEHIFEVTKETILKDATLTLVFTDSVKELHVSCSESTIKEVHTKLLIKYYNARSNEFLRNVTKLTCIKSNKAVDVNVGLRDKLKCYAVDKHTVNE